MFEDEKLKKLEENCNKAEKWKEENPILLYVIIFIIVGLGFWTGIFEA